MKNISLSLGIISRNGLISDQLNRLTRKPFYHSIVFQTDNFPMGEEKLKELRPVILFLDSCLIKEDIMGILMKLKMSYPEWNVLQKMD